MQIFDVAFSRRICCSRVESVRHEPAISVAVDGLTGKAPGHLAQILLFRRDHTAERPAIAERNAERLRLHADNIGLNRRPNHTERNRLGDRDDQQRALLVRNLGDRRNVFDQRRRSWGSAPALLQFLP